jgi:predicted HTH transcriptional regulator
MIDLCREQGLPEPEYQSDGYTVKIVFWKKDKKDVPNDPNNVTDGGGNSGGNNVSSDVSSLSVAQLSERQKKIYELIKNDSYISGERMSVVLSVAPRTIWRDLAAMQKKGIILHEGNTSSGHWKILIDNFE